MITSQSDNQKAIQRLENEITKCREGILYCERKIHSSKAIWTKKEFQQVIESFNQEIASHEFAISNIKELKK